MLPRHLTGAGRIGPDLDAALPWFGRQIYFLQGCQLRSVRPRRGSRRPGISAADRQELAGLTRDFAADLDAAVNWGGGFVYFFKGDRYLRYHMVANQAYGPYKIADTWEGLPAAGFDRDLDACLP